jgi:hypothetical protein
MVGSRFFCEYGPDNHSQRIIAELETVFAHALESHQKQRQHHAIRKRPTVKNSGVSESCSQGVTAAAEGTNKTSSKTPTRRGGRKYATTKKAHTSGSQPVAAGPTGGESVAIVSKKRKRVPQKPSITGGHQSPTPALNAAGAPPSALASNMHGPCATSERPSPTGGLQGGNGVASVQEEPHSSKPLNPAGVPLRKTKVAKMSTGLTRKRGCQYFFVAKQLYVDQDLCELSHHSWDHKNVEGHLAHGSSYEGFRHSFGARLTSKTKRWIQNCLRLGFSPVQIMAKHKESVMKAAALGVESTRDTFILPSDVYNLAKKRAQELYERHKNDAVSIRMWAEENIDAVFFFQEHDSIDLNEEPRPECTYTLGIQTSWQLKVMAKFGDRSGLSFDATFGTNTSWVRHEVIFEINCSCFSDLEAIARSVRSPLCEMFLMCFFCAVPSLYCDGVRRMAQRNTGGLHDYEQVLGGGHSGLVNKTS